MVVLSEKGDVVLRPFLRSGELDVSCVARFQVVEPADLDDFVDGFFGHLSISGPFTTGNGDEAVIRGEQEVGSDDALGGGALFAARGDRARVSDQGSDTCPGAKDVLSLDGELDVVLQFFQDVLDVRLSGHGVFRDLFQGDIRGAREDFALPGQEKHHSAVGSPDVEQANVLRTVKRGQDDVDTDGGDDHFRVHHGDLVERGLDLGVVVQGRVGLARGVAVHLQDGVAVGPRGVDHALGVDPDELVGLDVARLGAHDLARGRVLDQLLDLDVVEDRGAVLDGGDGQRGVQPRVVEGPVVVHERRLQVVRGQHGRLFDGGGLGQQVRALQVLLAREEVVELAPGVDVRHLPRVVDGDEDGQHRAQVRRGVDEVFALVERLDHEVQLRLGELPERLLQVPHAPVNHLGGLGRRARGKVALLDQRHVEAPGGGVQGAPGPGGPATDDQHVELVRLAQPVQQVSPAHLRRSRSGELHHVAGVVVYQGPFALRRHPVHRPGRRGGSSNSSSSSSSSQ